MWPTILSIGYFVSFGGSLFGHNHTTPNKAFARAEKVGLFASSPRSAPCLRIPVGYPLLSLPRVLRARVKVNYWAVVFQVGVLCMFKYPTRIRIKHKQYIRSVSINPIICFSKISHFLKNSPSLLKDIFRTNELFWRFFIEIYLYKTTWFLLFDTNKT